MKTVFLALFCFMCAGGVSVMSAERPARGRMKGVELYSWPESGKWMFVLLNGTNGVKSEEQVKKSPNRVDTVAALGAQFMELAKGENVVWNFHFVPGFSFPDEKSFAAVVAAAKRAEINLIPDERKDARIRLPGHLTNPQQTGSNPVQSCSPQPVQAPELDRAPKT